MPERVTREERTISMAIEKARSTKEILYNSLMDNNRNPMEDKSEAVKVKRPRLKKIQLSFNQMMGRLLYTLMLVILQRLLKSLKQLKNQITGLTHF